MTTVYEEAASSSTVMETTGEVETSLAGETTFAEDTNTDKKEIASENEKKYFVFNAEKARDEYTDTEGMELEFVADTITLDSIDIEICNKGNRNIMYGDHRALYYLDGEEWRYVEHTKDENGNEIGAMAIDLARYVESGETVTLHEKLMYYDELPAGRYRYSLDEFVLLGVADLSIEKKKVYIEFEIN